MTQPEFSERQIAFVLRKVDDGAAVEDVCRMAGISRRTYERWRHAYGVLMSSQTRRLKQLEDENELLKRLVADLSLTKQLLQQAIRSSNHDARVSAAGGRARVQPDVIGGRYE